MKNITVSVNDTAYRNARVWAAKRDTSISAVVTYLLENLPGLKVAQRGFPLESPPATANGPCRSPQN
jgi:hypothetical protein